MDLFLKNVLQEHYTKNFLPSEGSQRIYIRIQCKQSSWILAVSTAKEHKQFIKKLKELKSAGLNVPFIKAQDLKKGFLLLEDLGKQSLLDIFFKKPEKKTFYYKQAIDQIMLLQNKMKTTRWPHFTQKQLFQEMLWTKKHLLDKLLAQQDSINFDSSCLKEWRNICQVLSVAPYAPAHRDYHSKNLMIKNQKVYWIDFQSAGFFPRYYDIVSLLYDPYVNMPAKERTALMEYFIHLCKSQKNLSADNSVEFFNKEFSKTEIQTCAVQRLFKACGNFAGFYNLKQQSSHLQYIKPALKQINTELKSLSLYPAFLNLISMALKKTVKLL